MRFPGFLGPSYQLRSPNADAQRCVNMYLEQNELGTGAEGEAFTMIGTPGLVARITLPQSPIRGSWVTADGRAFAVAGNALYEIFSDYTYISRGTLSTLSGQVSMADDGVRLALVDGSVNGKFLTLATNAFAAIPFPTEINFIAFQGADQVSYQDGYFIFNHSGTNQFFISGLLGSSVADDSTFDALDFASSEANPDVIVAHISNHRDLWMFNAKTTEVFFNSGNTFPFERIQGAFVEIGCAAAFSVAKMGNTVFWLGQDERGSGLVMMAQGYQPQRISTHAIEFAISQYGDVSGAVAWTYQDQGHYFYALNFPNATTTWVYDMTTKLWHERTYFNNGSQERHRADNHMFAFSTHLVGDYDTGVIYSLESSAYTDNTAPIQRIRAAPHITKDKKRIQHSRFQLDLEPGVGLDGTGQGTDPQAILQWSDDGGHTWSNEHWTSMGQIGQTKNRLIWRRLGMARDRVYRFTITDPVKIVIIGAELDTMEAAS